VSIVFNPSAELLKIKALIRAKVRTSMAVLS
jgi:hypothetical protein